MAGVLCQRLPAPIEIYNDLDQDLYNWWTVVRDRGAELEEMLYHTPIWSYDHWLEAKGTLQHCDIQDPVRRAYWYTLGLGWGFNSARDLSTAKRFYGLGHGSNGSCDFAPRIRPLARRMRGVHIERRDAAALIHKVGSYGPKALLYVDPPYRDADDRLYLHTSVDRPALTEALQAATARVAVSGYGDEWDHLDWRRYTLDTYTTTRNNRPARTEVLWTNFATAYQERLPL